MKLILATHNDHKLQEFKAILKRIILDKNLSNDLSILDSIISASDLEIGEIAETQFSFADNSKLKAQAVFQATKLPTVADDSGLIVRILGEAPGILSARWSGKHGNDKANIDLLLSQLSDIPFRGRSAYFTCFMTLIEPRKNNCSNIKIAEGQCSGFINDKPLGENGFGYDPIFMPDAYFGNYQNSPTPGRSLADLPQSFKNLYSHRAKAIEQLFDDIYRILTIV
ncbi:MAG: non-canonical purine NTP pyrophosphatase [Bifidobacteriaceae bacterium]|jgi:XTP/dITP diphosphohydrolase|nr:non-canonical purine NTP pyrophosphatase [Bifidobacteriaceae bacterium]